MLEFRIDDLRFRPGCTAGLDEPTALVDIAVAGAPAPGAAERIRDGMAALCPEEPLHGVTESDWPAAFLMGESGHIGDWVVAVTVALQRWARDPVWRGQVVSAGPDRLRVAIPWQREDLFDGALRLALNLIAQWAAPVADPAVLGQLIGYFHDDLATAQRDGLPPNTMRFIQAAVERTIPFDVRPTFVQLGWGAVEQRMDSSFTGNTSYLATALARDKPGTSKLLADQGVPVPGGAVVPDAERAVEIAARLGWPVVVKPVDQDQGAGVVPGIVDEVALRHAFEAASRLGSGRVIVERHVDGDDHRLLVVDGRMLMAVRRIPGGVTGDGLHTVEQLVDLVNADPRRGSGGRSQLRRLVFDREALDCLDAQDVPIASVPDNGRWIPLRRTANISTGGTAEDVTDIIHPDNRELAERVARLVGLDIAGIDFLTPDIGTPWRETDCGVCEVNAQPGFRPHWIADPDRDINGEIIDILFEGSTGRIPTAAITGTNGKTTTAMMLHHIWATAGKTAGVCTTAQVQIGDEIVSTDNLSGYPGARMILNDPAVEAAVFEMPRKGLVVFGHPCDRYDVAALLNVQDDHLGEFGIATLDQMAELKAEVLARATGAVVVNADDPLCMSVLPRAGTERHVLVTADPATVSDHRRRGGAAVFVLEHNGNPSIVMADADDEEVLIAIDDIPATMNGLLRVNVSNAMFAAAIAWAHGIGPAAIRTALASFRNSLEQNPGRFTFVEGLPFRVLIDYAHNPDGVRELCAVVSKIEVSGRRILCSRTLGNHAAENFAASAGPLAANFDSFLIGCTVQQVAESPDYAGADSVGTMLTTARQSLLDHGVGADSIVSVRDPKEVVSRALAQAQPGDLLVILASARKVMPLIEEFRSST